VYRGCIEGEGKSMVLVGTDAYWTHEANPLRREDINEISMSYFYASQTMKVTRGKYHMIVKSFPDKMIRLYLRKNGGVDARVSIQGKEATLVKVYLQISKARMTVDEIWMYGTFNGGMLSEQVPITETMKACFAEATNVFNWL